MSSLRQRLIHDLQLRHRSTGTIRTYVSHVCGLTRSTFLANGHAAAKLELCRRLLQQPTSLAETADLETAHEAVFEEETLRLCPICRAGRLLLVRAMLPRGGIQPLQSALLPLWPGRTLRGYPKT